MKMAETAGNARRGGQERSCSRRRAIPFGGAVRRSDVVSFARCAGDAGRRPALRCRAPSPPGAEDQEPGSGP